MAKRKAAVRKSPNKVFRVGGGSGSRPRPQWWKEQLGVAYYSSSSQGGGEERLPLVLDDTTITFTAAQIKGHSGSVANQLYAQHCLYWNGDTHLIYALDIDDYFCRPHILSYFEDIGLDRPTPVNTFGGADSHARPSAIIDNDGKMRVLSELGHNSPLRIYTANHPGDVYSFKKEAEEIGTSQSYPQLFKLQDSTFFVLGQVINSQTAGGAFGDSDFANWSDDTAIGQTVGDVNYQTTPQNYMISSSGWVYFCINDRGSIGGDPWYKRYLFKTKDFLTLYNFDESFSKTGLLIPADYTNFLYYDPGLKEDETRADGYLPVCTLDDDENFFAVAANATDYDFIFRLQGDPGFTTRAIGLSDYVDDTLSIQQSGAIPLIIPISLTDIRIFVRQDTDGTARMYQYKTTDLGQSWELIGDVFPDVSVGIGRVTTAYNVAQIPNNKNFMIVGTELTADVNTLAGFFVRKCAFGEIQAETEAFYNTACTFEEFNAGAIRSFWAEDAYITRSGANVSALLDQSPTGEDATGGNNPQYASNDGEYITFNGSNHYFSLDNPSDILAMGEGTVFIVAKKDTATKSEARILSGANSGVSNASITFGLNKGGMNNSIYSISHFGGTNGYYHTYGDDDVGTGWHIFVYMHCDGVVNTHWIDGKKQFWNVSVGTSTINSYNRNGAFFDDVTLNNVNIGRQQGPTPAYFDFKMKHVSIHPVLSMQQIRERIKFLADRYSITLNSHFQ